MRTLQEKIDGLKAEGFQQIEVHSAWRGKFGSVQVILADGNITDAYPGTYHQRIRMPGGEGRLMPCIPPTR